MSTSYTGKAPVSVVTSQVFKKKKSPPNPTLENVSEKILASDTW